MYSIVLMAAMTAGPDASGFNGYFRDLFQRDNGGSCNGCNGCSGSTPRYAGFGGCCGGAADYYSCSGCCGGSASGGFGSRVRRLFQPGNCCGTGCCGGMAYSCQGSAAYSCFGAPVGYMPVMNGGLSCVGGPVPFAPAPTFEPYAVPGVAPPGMIPYAPPEVAPPGAVRPAGFGGTVVGAAPTVQQTGRATVVIRLPADARLYADDAPLRLSGPERKFTTPDLPANLEYTYRLRAEYDRDGEVVSVTKKVTVRAGGAVAVDFADLTVGKPAAPTPSTGGNVLAASPVSNPSPGTVPSVLPGAMSGNPGANTPGSPATDRAMITVTLPPGATLYVDDRKSPSSEPVRQFATPPLPAGREFAYLLKAEVTRDGRPESITQKVTFRAGERLTVDFTGLGK